MDSARNRTPRRTERDWSQRGVAAIEYALLLPVYLMITMSLIDLGRGLFVRHALLEAAQAGARVAAMPSTSMSDVNIEVHRILDKAKLSAASVAASNVGRGSARGVTTSVTVSLPLTPLTGKFVPGWAGTITMMQIASARHE